VVEALPIAKFYGVGAATAKKMQALGIHKGADLKQWSEADLVQHFGKAGSYYYRVARAEDERPVNPYRIRKSIGAEQSFADDLEALTRWMRHWQSWLRSGDPPGQTPSAMVIR
jgi:DNA polymerase-4